MPAYMMAGLRRQLEEIRVFYMTESRDEEASVIGTKTSACNTSGAWEAEIAASIGTPYTIS